MEMQPHHQSANRFRDTNDISLNPLQEPAALLMLEKATGGGWDLADERNDKQRSETALILHLTTNI